MKRYELLVFDWDGTLMDSAGDIVAAMREAIRALDLPPREDGEMRRLIGLGLTDAFDRLYPELGEEGLRAVIERYRGLYGRVPQLYGQVFPGVERELDTLAGHGFHLAVATGKSRRGLDRALTAIAWHHRFRATRCADETAGKPDPLMLEELLWELDIAPQRALMIGDTSYDMEMARRAGVDALGVAWGVHEAEELAAAGALDVLPRIPGLTDWLRNR